MRSEDSQSELQRVAHILAAWAEPLPIARAYLFGSIPRGDFTDATDVDVAIEYDTYADDRAFELWEIENSTDFKNVKQKLKRTLSLHDKEDDKAWPAIREAAEIPLFQLGKIVVVLTPP